MKTHFSLRSGQIIGRGHLISGKNRQDAISSGDFETKSGKRVIYAVICDGCSQGKSSEMGASLAANFLGRQIEKLSKANISIDKIPAILHKRVLGFLKNLLGKISFGDEVARNNFILENMLFTVLGFILIESEIAIFAQGDGVFIVNDEITVRDEGNIPHYVAYNLMPKKYFGENENVVVTSFDTFRFDLLEIEKLAIASDALGEEIGFTKELWGYKNPSGLQRKMNVMSDNHKFHDDLSVITLEKTVTLF